MTLCPSAFADHRAAGIIREARATIVLATQTYTSIHGSLDRRYADVLMLNLSNELIFTVSDEAFEFLVRRGIHKALGTRPLKETLQKFIGDAVRDTIKIKCAFVRRPGCFAPQ